jgi:hypothetical protein
VLILEHQDGNIQYELEKGGFAVVDSKLYISVQTKVVDKEAFPNCYYFAIDGFPISNELKSSQIKISTNIEDKPPNVYVYTSFHACEVEATVKITMVADQEIKVTLDVLSEDVKYYNEKAKPNPFRGTVTLVEKSLDELWIPS